MKTFIHKSIIVFILLFASETEANNELKTRWLPDHVKSQFAGNIGFLSIGAGYSFFKGKIESDLFYGYVSKERSQDTIHHITQKNNYIPFSTPVSKNIIWQPISIGTHFSYKIGDNNRQTWLILPNRYPDSYYFSTAFHFLFSLGTSFQYRGAGIMNNTGFYLEASTVDLYLRNWIRQDYVKMSDTFSLSIGIKKSFY